MLGGIYGDKVGSIYEFEQTETIKSINPEILITKESFFSDDTIETIAVADAIINKKDYEETLKRYILDFERYDPNFKPYFKYPFSPGAIKWAKGLRENKSEGNGALMRISPVGFLFDNEKDVIDNARLVTITSHNTEEAINSAIIISKLIFYFRNNIFKEKAFELLNIKPEYKEFKKFNTSCSETISNCLYAIYNSNSFEDAIRKTLLMGGDTDTNCCIVGSVCEALYGMSDKQKEDAFNNLPENFIKVLKKIY